MDVILNKPQEYLPVIVASHNHYHSVAYYRHICFVSFSCHVAYLVSKSRTSPLEMLTHNTLAEHMHCCEKLDIAVRGLLEGVCGRHAHPERFTIGLAFRSVRR